MDKVLTVYTLNGACYVSSEVDEQAYVVIDESGIVRFYFNKTKEVELAYAEYEQAMVDQSELLIDPIRHIEYSRIMRELKAIKDKIIKN